MVLCRYACPSGSVNATSVLCTAGTYSVGLQGTCTTCPPQTPYSLPGATSLDACVTCTQGCEARGYGTHPCPEFPTWTPWFDRGGVEQNHSCVLFVPTRTDWAKAASACESMGQGAHLLTARQTIQMNFGGGQDLLTVAYRLTNSSERTFLGGSRDASNPPLGGWSWIDGTPADNLACGSKGCVGMKTGGCQRYCFLLTTGSKHRVVVWSALYAIVCESHSGQHGLNVLCTAVLCCVVLCCTFRPASVPLSHFTCCAAPFQLRYLATWRTQRLLQRSCTVLRRVDYVFRDGVSRWPERRSWQWSTRVRVHSCGCDAIP
jgi:hypothetical protein